MKLMQVLGCTLVLGTNLLAQQQNSPGTANPPAQPAKAAATPQASSDAAEPSCLCVYRARRYAGGALAPSIYVDDRHVARVGSGRRIAVKLTAGERTIHSDDKSSSISLDVKPGETYFVRIDEEPGFWKGHGKLTLVFPEQGVAEYKLEKPVEDDRRFDKELILDDSQGAAACSKK